LGCGGLCIVFCGCTQPQQLAVAKKGREKRILVKHSPSLKNSTLSVPFTVLVSCPGNECVGGLNATIERVDALCKAALASAITALYILGKQHCLEALIMATKTQPSVAVITQTNCWWRLTLAVCLHFALSSAKRCDELLPVNLVVTLKGVENAFQFGT